MTELSLRFRTASVARDLIAEVAPGELPRFPVTSETFFTRGGRLARGGREDMLGFGAHEAATFLTPVILMAVSRVMEFASEPAKDTLQSGLSDLMGRFVRWVSNKLSGKRSEPEGKTEFQPLTPDQLLRARSIALQTLVQHGFPEDKTDIVADLIVAKLAVPDTRIS